MGYSQSVVGMPARKGSSDEDNDKESSSNKVIDSLKMPNITLISENSFKKD